MTKNSEPNAQPEESQEPQQLLFPVVKPKRRAKGNERAVVKSNRLNTAQYNLSLPEVRLMQLAIINARETGTGFTKNEPLILHASQYAEAFGVSASGAYKALSNAGKKLLGRTFVFLDRKDGNLVGANWVQRIKYLDAQGAIELIFTVDVAEEIYNLDGRKQFFSQYALRQTASIQRVYSLRLYELLIQWVYLAEFPVFDLNQIRLQLEVKDGMYPQYSDFRKRILEPAIKEVNETTDIKVTYEPVRTGRIITGLQFEWLQRPTKTPEELEQETTQEIEEIEKVVESEVGDFILSERQSFKFSRLLANDPAFSKYLPPGSCKTVEQAVTYLNARLSTDAQFVRKIQKHLNRHGFVMSSAKRVES